MINLNYKAMRVLTLKTLFSFFFTLCVFLTNISICLDEYSSIKNTSSLSFTSPRAQSNSLYKYELKNGLQVLIIHDPFAKNSSAAVTVRTGSWSDPENIPGLAHFLEHMLFMGTEDNPSENSFSEYIQSHDGFYNAFTSPSQTTYYFTLANEFLPDAFEHLASFFKNPLFNPDAISREINAVHQEWKKNLNNDSFLRMYLLKSHANSSHPHSHFSIGANFTLAKAQRKDLFDFFDRYYSPENIHLVIYSPEDPSTTIETISSLFSPISKRPYDQLNINTPMFDNNLSGSLFTMEAKTSAPSLLVQWQIPTNLAHSTTTKPYEYISYMLNDTSENGLGATLRNKNLAREFEAGSLQWNKDCIQMYCYFELTPEGSNDISSILNDLYTYINTYSQIGVNDDLFNEMNFISRQAYETESFQDPSQFVLFASKALTTEPLYSFPEQTVLVQENNPEHVSQLFNELNPSNATYFLMTNNSTEKLDEISKWNQVPYKVEKIPQKQLEKLSMAIDSTIQPPTANPYIVERKKSHHKADTPPSFLPSPTRIINSPGLNIYHAKDTHWLTDDDYISLLYSPKEYLSGTNPQNNLTLELLVSIFKEKAYRTLTLAQKAGYKISFDISPNGILLSVCGHKNHAWPLFNDLMQVWADTIKSSNEDIFQKHKVFLSQEIDQQLISSPLTHARDLFRTLTRNNHYTIIERQTTLSKLSFESFSEIKSAFTKSTYIQGISYGQHNNEQAVESWNNLSNALKQSHHLNHIDMNQSISLSSNKGPYIFQQRGKFQGNTAYLVIQPDTFSFDSAACQDIQALLIKEPFFDTLRTKQQTGYIVGNANQIIHKSLFDIYVVQSDSHCPRDLLARFELFFEDWLKAIESSSDSLTQQFEDTKNARINTLTYLTNDILSTGDHLSNLLYNYNQDFDWHRKRVSALKALNLNDFMLYLQQALSPENRRRIAFLVKGQSDRNMADYKKLPNIKALRNKAQSTK